MLPTMTELAAAMVARQEMPPEKGELGPIGPNGKAGLDGENGRNGDPGPKGDTGDRGPIGANGADGRNGADGKDGVNGEPGLVWRGPWVRNLQYWADDAVEQDGSSYVCTLATRSKPPSGAWDLLAKRGATGPPGMSRGGGGGSGGGSSSLTVKDEGITLDAAVGSIDFVGAGVTATAVGHSLTVTIPGGGGTQDLEAVLTVGNDGGALGMVNVGEIRGLEDAGFLGGSIEAQDGNAAFLRGGPVNFSAGQSAAGNTGGELGADGGDDGSNAGGSIALRGGTGIAADANGGIAQFLGGAGNITGTGGSGIFGGGDAGGEGGAQIVATGGSAGTPGRLSLRTDNSTGNTGDVLTSDGADALWGTVIDALIAGGGQAAFVDPLTATPEAIANSLIAAGLMAAA